MGRADQRPHRRDQARQAGQHIGMNDVAVNHVRTKAPHDAAEPQQRERIRNSRPHVQAMDVDTIAPQFGILEGAAGGIMDTTETAQPRHGAGRWQDA